MQIIFADRTTVVWCLVTRSQDGGPSISSGTRERQAASASLTVEGGFGPSDSVGIMGRVAESARVVRILAGGRVIEASHRDGFYAASWRGSDLPTLVVAYDGDDRLIGTLDHVTLGEFFRDPR